MAGRMKCSRCDTPLSSTPFHAYELIRFSNVLHVFTFSTGNAAFDAGYASALGKEIITLHPPEISHMLKEVNSAASVVCEAAGQVVDTLAYVINGDLPPPRDGDKFVPIADRLGAGNPNP